MKTRMSIGLPQAPQEFVDDVLDVVNATRSIRHHVLNGSGRVETIDGGVVQESAQGVATFVRDGSGLTVAYEPDLSVAAGFVPVVFRLSRAAFPDSPLWTVDEKELVRTFTEHAGELTDRGVLVGYSMGEGPHENFVLMEAPADEGDHEIEGLVEDLSNATDVASSGAWSIRRRWKAFGSPSIAEPVSPEGVVYRVPAEDDPDTGRRQAGFRIRLLQKWMETLPAAIIVTRRPDRTYDLMPHSLTRQAPSKDEADEVRRKGVQAYHRLTTLNATGTGQ